MQNPVVIGAVVGGLTSLVVNLLLIVIRHIFRSYGSRRKRTFEPGVKDTEQSNEQPEAPVA